MRAVVFDLDGTLIDSAPDIRASLNRVLVAEGLAPLGNSEVIKMIGDGAKVLLERGFGARGRAYEPRYLAAFLADYEPNSVVATAPFPGMVGALEALEAAGYMLGICTNKPEEATRRILTGLELGRFFKAVVGGDTTPYKKPDSRHLAATLEALGAKEAVMVGDHENDINAAAGLGVPSVFVGWGYGVAEGTYRAETADELPAIIRRIFK